MSATTRRPAAPVPTFRPRALRRPDVSAIDLALVAAIALCLALQGWLALVMEINWDEFHYLAQIYQYQRGELTGAAQTVHVHLFGWLTRLGGDEIRQIEAGRLVMLACEAGTCALTYALARAFFSRTASLVAALAFVTAGFTIIHGASFRTDPLAAVLGMAALVLIARGALRVPAQAGAASAAALAALVTLKVAFYAPAFAGVAAWRWAADKDRRKVLRWLAAAAFSAVILFVGLYLLHFSMLPSASHGGSQAVLSASVQTTIVDGGLLPRAREILQWLILSPVQTALLVLGLAGIVLERGDDRLRRLVVLACAAPLLSLLFYRNAFPYFFAFILPPATLLVAWAIDQFAPLKRHALLLAIGMTVPAAAIAVGWSRHDQSAQRQLVSAVHRMFPEPVSYIDRSGMIASFPKRGFFMSSWGTQSYQRKGPVFETLLSTETVPLLLVNGPGLEHAVGLRPTVSPMLSLFPEDRQLLRSTYVHHWGPIWIAGQKVRTGPVPAAFEITVPGPYTVGQATAEIDGRPVPQDGVVTLSRGSHSIRSASPAGVTLRWGRHLHKPAEPPSSNPVFRGF